MTLKESELRNLLKEKADEISLDQRIPEVVHHRASSRALPRRVGAALVVTALCVGAPVLLAQPGDRAPTRPGRNMPSAIDLLDYYEQAPGEDESRGALDEASLRELERHVACMRQQGFNLPDPTREDQGWSIVVDDPEEIGFETPEWRRAAFVECPPKPPSGAGDLIFGLGLTSRPGSEEFRACMAEQGFDLPPARATDEHWRFDLSGVDIDLGSRRWNEALFVTCWIGRWQ